MVKQKKKPKKKSTQPLVEKDKQSAHQGAPILATEGKPTGPNEIEKQLKDLKKAKKITPLHDYIAPPY